MRASNGRALGVTVAFAILVTVGLVAGLPTLHSQRAKQSLATVLLSESAPDPACIALIAALPADDVDVLTPLLASYNASAPQVNGRCVEVRAIVRSSGSAAAALVRGWNPKTDGPPPDVWLPGASTWVSLVRAAAGASSTSVLGDSAPGFAQSPLVIAMPKPMADALGWPQKSLGFADLVAIGTDPAGWGSDGHPEWGALRLGKTSPLFSTSGLAALVAAYFAATGSSADLTAEDLSNPKVAGFAHGVELATVHYGDSSTAFLRGLAQADAAGASLTYVSAVALEERQVIAYNATHPHVPLAAVYPKEGTLISDNPFVTLKAAWVSADQKLAADNLLSYLLKDPQQSALRAAGYRDSQGRPGPAIGAETGTLPDHPAKVIKPPTGAILAQLQAAWWHIRKPARVLVIVDTSGSMDDAVPGTGASKLKLVKLALSAAVDQLGADDEVGLWTFASDTTPVVPVAVVDAAQKERLHAGISQMVANGNTRLYDSVELGLKTMSGLVDPGHITAIVVLTDGEDGSSKITLDALTGDESKQPPGKALRVFTIAYGSDADHAGLSKIAAASQGGAYDATNPALISEVFNAVLSNF